MRTLIWFRGKDLRLHDHAALAEAAHSSRELVLAFVLSEKYFAPGGAERAPHRMQYLLAALAELQAAIRARGNRLLIVPGPAARALPELCERAGVQRVFALGSVEPGAREQAARVAAALRVPLTLFEGETLLPAGSVRTRSGSAFQVFTPFSQACAAQLASTPELRLMAPLPAPLRLPSAPPQVAAIAASTPALATLGLAENPQLIAAGELAARVRLQDFLATHAPFYPELRDRMDLACTSRLSADLHFGTTSIRSVWSAAHATLARRAPPALERFRTQLLWREFAHHTLADRPGVLREPFRADFRDFPFRDDRSAWDAWQHGMTGYPVVDAAARQLRTEGFVHNRARMIAASFLTKHLLISYARGEAHYLKWLCDGDLAQNNLGWQWSAGTGCDAQPYFRVFNPQTQGERFDPDGDYVRRYVPELAGLSSKHIHAPAQAPAAELASAGVVLGRTYPQPIVDHATARQRYLLVAGEHLAARRASVTR